MDWIKIVFPYDVAQQKKFSNYHKIINNIYIYSLRLSIFLVNSGRHYSLTRVISWHNNNNQESCAGNGFESFENTAKRNPFLD